MPFQYHGISASVTLIQNSFRYEVFCHRFIAWRTFSWHIKISILPSEKGENINFLGRNKFSNFMLGDRRMVGRKLKTVNLIQWIAFLNQTQNMYIIAAISVQVVQNMYISKLNAEYYTMHNKFAKFSSQSAERNSQWRSTITR